MLSLTISPLVISFNIDLLKIKVNNTSEILSTETNCVCHEFIKQLILKDTISNNLYTVFLRKLLESKQSGLGATRTTDPQSVPSDESPNSNLSCGLLSRQMIGSDRSTMTGSNNPSSENQPWLTDVTTGNIRDISHSGGMLQLPSSSVCGTESGPLFPNQSGIFRPTMSMITPTNLASQQQHYAPQYQSHFSSIGGSNLSLFYRQSHLTYPPAYTHYRPHMSGTTHTIVPGNQYIQVEPYSLLSNMQNVVPYTQPQLPHSPAFRATNTIGSRDPSSYPQFHIPDKNREETNSAMPYTSLISKQDKQLSKSPSSIDKDAKSSQVNRTLKNEQTSFADPNTFREKGQIKIKTQSLSSAYQIPSGKEGSLKHRILRPPQNINITPTSISVINEAPHSAPPTARDSKEVISPKQARFSTPITTKQEQTYTLSNQNSSSRTSVISTRSQLHHPTYFTKGSIIQLANGLLKQVEELTTDDFVESAALSTNLSMDRSTVVKIEEKPESGLAVLGFSVGFKQVQVTVEAPLEHPFFIFNQGWSSCSPEQSLQRYRLSCNKLKVGDICISLTHKSTQTSGQSVLSSNICDSKSVLVPNSVANPNQSAIFLPLQKFHTQGCKKTDHAVCHTPDYLHSNTNSSQMGTTRKRRWSAPDQFSL